MSRRYSCAFFSLLAMVLSLQAVPASAIGILDQSVPLPSDPGDIQVTGTSRLDGQFGRVQTFTVGLSGILSEIQVSLDLVPGQSPPTLLLRGTDASGVPLDPAVAPIATVVSSDPYPGSGFQTYSFDLLSEAIAVSVGDVFAIDVLAQFGQGDWAASRETAYPGGAQYTFNLEVPGQEPWVEQSRDMVFSTFVIPEPGTGVLLGLGLALGAAARRRR